MMDNIALIDWLKENGGPAIKLLMIKEAMIDKKSYDLNKLADDMLQNEEIQNELNYFDQFKEYTTEFGTLVHNCYENCFERFMPILLSLGFQTGIKVFNEKIKYVEKVYPISAEQDLQKDRMPFAAIIIIWHLLKAGYYSEDIERYTLHRLEYIHKVSVLEKFDFYEDDITNIRQPNKWKDHKILKDMYNPFVYNPGWEEYPLPIIYDIKLILYFYDKINDIEIKKKIDDIMRYILNPLYQANGGDYGWIWAVRKNTYHGCTCGFGLPLYNSDDLGNSTWSFLDCLDLASYSPVLLKSDWMKKCMNFMEQYKTEKGTYIFPDKFFSSLTYHNPIPKALFYKMFTSKDVLPFVKRNNIKSLAFELYSTFFMMKLKKRMES